MNTITVGSKVKVNCPALKNNRTIYGVVKSVINEITITVIYEGNTKSSKIAKVWCTVI